MKVSYHIAYSFWHLLSLLPLGVLYFISDLLFPVVFYLARYRRRIVRRNLENSFPEKSPGEIDMIEKDFYHFFSDQIAETIRLFSMPEEEMRRRMRFEGTEEIISAMRNEDRNFCFVLLGHYGNWEWIASLPYWFPQDILCAQIYHPLKSQTMDRLFLKARGQFGGMSIPMKETLRRIVELRARKQKAIIGFISDQTPKWQSIHHFTNFLCQDTPVFTGTEKIARQVDAMVYWADVERLGRGYYRCTFRKITDHPEKMAQYEITDRFTALLEEMIRKNPSLWLWSHNRWKRTRQQWMEWNHMTEYRER